jgi:hypothetical protein
MDLFSNRLTGWLCISFQSYYGHILTGKHHITIVTLGCNIANLLENDLCRADSVK